MVNDKVGLGKDQDGTEIKHLGHKYNLNLLQIQVFREPATTPTTSTRLLNYGATRCC